MRVSLNWLKDYIPLTLPAETLAERLTMAGLEVGKIDVKGGAWDNIFIARIVDIKPHPNADRLRLAEVDLGAEREVVVCGAPNIQVGQKVSYARVGAKMFDTHTGKTETLQPAKIRGVVSRGMICSAKEMGISEDLEGILVLPETAPLGAALKDYLGDTVLDFELTPNRPDCFCMIGIAREAAALTGAKVTYPPADYPEEEAPAGELASVEIADPDLCRRYCATIIRGVKIGPSPQWMQDRLTAYGMRSINNIVDITNYVMIEYGQPLHAFDYDRLRGHQIIVRRAREGEIITSLDGVERKLNPRDLMITDAGGSVAIAGVMGGANSEVAPETTNILLESANFDRASIRRTVAGMGLRSEASMRFEKGLRPELALEAVKRATYLMRELAGGKVARGIIDAYPGWQEPAPVTLSAGAVKRLLGVNVPEPEVISILTSLGFIVETTCAPDLKVTPPWWRSDIGQPADVIEEIARIRGYDSIPLTLLSTPLPSYQPQPMLELKDRVRDILASLGLQEVLNYTLTNPEVEQKAAAGLPAPASLRVVNPLSRDQEYLRTSLRPGLFTTLASNQRHEESGIRIFEVGRVFIPRDKDLPDEREMAAALFCGPRSEISWLGKTEAMDFYDAKGALEDLLERLKVEAQFVDAEDPALLKGRTAEIRAGEERLGIMGEVNPEVSRGFDIAGTVLLFELRLAALLPLVAAASGKYQPLPRFPEACRDLAIIVDAGVPSELIGKIIRTSPLVEEAEVFDVYAGDKMPKGKKSLAWRITWQSRERTLTDDEIENFSKKILDKLSKELGAMLRA